MQLISNQCPRCKNRASVGLAHGDEDDGVRCLICGGWQGIISQRGRPRILNPTLRTIPIERARITVSLSPDDEV